jgi:FKBP-type peptidyl-prolyl cis-trans isomerase
MTTLGFFIKKVSFPNYADDTATESLILRTVKFAKLLFVFGAVNLLAVPLAQAQREKLPPEDLEYVEKNFPEARKTMTGIRYIIMREGQGEMPKPGDKVAVLYVLRLLHGKMLDQADDRNNPFTFRIRRDEVIEGWDQVLQQMKVGEKRLVIVPSELAYGTRGQPPKIPRSATLIFEIDLLEIRKDQPPSGG